MQNMRREGITDVLTNDRHFEQEGFRAILRESYQRTSDNFRSEPAVRDVIYVATGRLVS